VPHASTPVKDRLRREWNAYLLDSGDPRERQEEAEVIGEVGVGAGDRFAAGQVLRLENSTVGGENESRLRLRCGGARPQRGQRLRDRAWRANGDVNVACLENATQVGLVGCARAQPLDRGFPVAERL
jgi:hypothetical protein